jgi:hypothetical protein
VRASRLSACTLHTEPARGAVRGCRSSPQIFDNLILRARSGGTFVPPLFSLAGVAGPRKNSPNDPKASLNERNEPNKSLETNRVAWVRSSEPEKAKDRLKVDSAGIAGPSNIGAMPSRLKVASNQSVGCSNHSRRTSKTQPVTDRITFSATPEGEGARATSILPGHRGKS